MYQLACLVDLLWLLLPKGAMLSVQFVIQVLKCLTFWSRLLEESRWVVLRASIHLVSEILLHLRWGAPGRWSKGW